MNREKEPKATKELKARFDLIQSIRANGGRWINEDDEAYTRGAEAALTFAMDHVSYLDANLNRMAQKIREAHTRLRTVPDAHCSCGVCRLESHI